MFETQNIIPMMTFTRQKIKFSKSSSVNVTKSPENCSFGHIY